MEFLNVTQSVDNEEIRVEGTEHALTMLRAIIDDVLKPGRSAECYSVAVNPINGVEVTVQKRLPVLEIKKEAGR